MTAAKLNQILGDATVSTSGVDGSTLTVNENGALAIRTGGIGTSSLANSGVTADKIATNAVTSNKIANDAVTREKINDFAVDTDRLATDAVTTAKIANLAVGTAEIQDNAVNLSKIADANLATAADNGTTIPDSDSKLPTAKLVKDAIGNKIDTLLITYAEQSMGTSATSPPEFATPTAFTSNFGATQLGGEFTVPNGTYIYSFFGTTNAGVTQRNILSLGNTVDPRLANIAYIGWTEAAVGPLKGFNNVVTVTNGKIGLMGSYYSNSTTISDSALQLSRVS